MFSTLTMENKQGSPSFHRSVLIYWQIMQVAGGLVRWRPRLRPNGGSVADVKI